MRYRPFTAAPRGGLQLARRARLRRAAGDQRRAENDFRVAPCGALRNDKKEEWPLIGMTRERCQQLLGMTEKRMAILRENEDETARGV